MNTVYIQHSIKQNCKDKFVAKADTGKICFILNLAAIEGVLEVGQAWKAIVQKDTPSYSVVECVELLPPLPKEVTITINTRTGNIAAWISAQRAIEKLGIVKVGKVCESATESYRLETVVVK